MLEKSLRDKIRLGTSGYSFDDWIGTAYPANSPKKDLLRIYQEHLGLRCVEINASYYRLMSDKVFQGMLNKTGPGFEFAVKAYRGTTHDPFDSRLGNKKPSLAQAKEDTGKFLYSVSPLKQAGRLGCVLLQYPYFFKNTPANRDYILQCQDWLAGLKLVVEFRSRDWADEATFEFLKKHRLGLCVVDEPQLSGLMPFVNRATSDIGYLRLHGRNKNWFQASRDERYHYDYSARELAGFMPEIVKLAGSVEQLYIFFNNCHLGLAAKNALALKGLMGLE